MILFWLSCTIFFLIWPLFKRLRQKFLHEFCCCFLVDLNTPKGHLEIYWLLGPDWIPLQSCVGTKRTKTFSLDLLPDISHKISVPFVLKFPNENFKFGSLCNSELWRSRSHASCMFPLQIMEIPFNFCFFLFEL